MDPAEILLDHLCLTNMGYLEIPVSARWPVSLLILFKLNRTSGMDTLQTLMDAVGFA
jgi:hypothetical protein